MDYKADSVEQKKSLRLRVYQTIRDVLHAPPELKTLRPETNLVNDLGYDSRDICILTLDLEAEFADRDLYIEDEELGKFANLKTVEDVVTYVTERLKK